MLQPGLYMGLMSGTSMDGVDAALIELTGAQFQLREYAEFPYPSGLRSRLESIVRGEAATLIEIGSLHVGVGEAFAEAATALLSRAKLKAKDVIAIGSHGQTLIHRPEDIPPFSLQIGDPSVIAWRTGVQTVADFRAMDIAAGGQGAPLVPAFHRYAFGSEVEARAVLNIGGIANLSLLHADRSVEGFDTGPGNTLLDGWAQQHLGQPCDTDGAWGRTGSMVPELLEAALANPYFSRKPPKSTGRDAFNMDWVTSLLRATGTMGASPVDVQRTLIELTSLTVAKALRASMPGCSDLGICGGGIHNSFLIERLAEHIHPLRPRSTQSWGIPPDAIEACAFAWLAAARLGGLAGNLPSVTGAAEAVCLGGIYAPKGGRVD